ncbi:MAG: hypothetical protein EOS18_34250 [Mesorhizobium sp.]|nr:MAG: hypothetical protein EOS18_34250 [Mesorhizobium sp.]
MASIEIDISSASYLLFILKALEAYWKVSSRAGRRLSQRLQELVGGNFSKEREEAKSEKRD